MRTHRMGRQRLFSGMAVALLAGLASAASGATSTTVYPTGSFPLDVRNVQAAIDGGGTVLLKATNRAGEPTAFNFGPPDFRLGSGVNLTTDVQVIGETVGPAMTTISGGYISFLGLVPVKTKIQGIDFEGPMDSPLVLVSSAGAEIVGNHINGVVPVPLGFGFTEGEGIFVSGFDDPQHAITGRIRVADNVIENLAGDFVNGMQFDEVSADIEITGNTVRFQQSPGFIQTLGILVFRSHGKATITKNQVLMGPGDPDVFPAAIFVGGHAEANYLISGNTVVCTNSNADGIDLVGLSFSGPTVHALVVGNHVEMHSTIPTAGGVDFVGAVQSSIMAANDVAGTSGNAIQILGLGGVLAATSNGALGNDISQLVSQAGDVFLGPDSFDTLVAGTCGTYVDLGVGNRILCGSALGLAPSRSPAANRPGPRVDMLAADVQRARLAALRDAHR